MLPFGALRGSRYLRRCRFRELAPIAGVARDRFDAAADGGRRGKGVREADAFDGAGDRVDRVLRTDRAAARGQFHELARGGETVPLAAELAVGRVPPAPLAPPPLRRHHAGGLVGDGYE